MPDVNVGEIALHPLGDMIDDRLVRLFLIPLEREQIIAAFVKNLGGDVFLTTRYVNNLSIQLNLPKVCDSSATSLRQGTAIRQ